MNIILVVLLMASFAFSANLPHETSKNFTNLEEFPNIPNDVRTVNISNSNLQKLSFENVPHDNALENLYLIGNKIEELPNSFGIFKNLRTVFLSDNNINFVNEDIFKDNQYLDLVDLSRNELTNFPILTSDSITELYVSSCPFESIPKNPLSSLTNLIKFKMENVKLLKTEDILNLLQSSVRHMLLDKTTISCSTYTNNFIENRKIKGMDVEGPECSSELEESSDASQLSCTTPVECNYYEYKMQCNNLNLQLTTVCKRDKRTIIVNGGNLFKLEPISNLQDIQILDINLDKNNIKYVDMEAFSNIFSLAILSLRDNQISDLPRDIIKHNQKLYKLILSGNKFTNAPVLVSNSLEVLDLSNCKINYLKNNIIEDLPQLKEINLDYNFLGMMNPVIKQISVRGINVSYKHNTVSTPTTKKIGVTPPTSTTEVSTENGDKTSSGTRNYGTYTSVILVILLSLIHQFRTFNLGTKSPKNTLTKYENINKSCENQFDHEIVESNENNLIVTNTDSNKKIKMLSMLLISLCIFVGITNYEMNASKFINYYTFDLNKLSSADLKRLEHFSYNTDEISFNSFNSTLFQNNCKSTFVKLQNRLIDNINEIGFILVQNKTFLQIEKFSN